MPGDIAQLNAGIDANDPQAVTSWLRDWGQHEAGNPAAADTVRAWARRTACWAAENGHGGVVSAMLDIGSKPLVEGIWKGHWRSPAALAAARGHAPFIAALAASTDPCVQGSLHQRCAIQQFTPADYAAVAGHASVMAELAASNDPLVRNSLFESPTAFGRGTPVERAAEAGHQAVVEAMVASGHPDVVARLCDPELAHGLRERHRTHAADALEAALDKGLLQRLHTQLTQSAHPRSDDLMADTQCPVTGEVYATRGPRRPMRPMMQKEKGQGVRVSHRGQCLSAAGVSMWERSRLVDLKDPASSFAAKPFPRMEEAHDRVVLLKALIEACKDAKGDWDKAATDALAIYETHLESEAAAGTPAHPEKGGTHHRALLEGRAPETGAGASARGAMKAAGHEDVQRRLEDLMVSPDGRRDYRAVLDAAGATGAQAGARDGASARGGLPGPS